MKYNPSEVYEICRQRCISLDNTLTIIFDVLDRMEEPYDDVEMYDALDIALMYYDDQWSILKEYCTPMEANWEYAIQAFIDDLFTILEAIR